jgi:hypothetical protein
MHRNTFLLVLILAIVAALLIGVNIGKKFTPPIEIGALPSPTPIPTPAIQTTFTSATCGISLTLPPGTTIAAEATNGAQFVSPDSTVVLLGCEKEIPKLAIPADKIETIQVASITAKLYHTTSTKDGMPFDALIFRNPTTEMDIYLAGLGSTFSAIIRSIEVLK